MMNIIFHKFLKLTKNIFIYVIIYQYVPIQIKITHFVVMSIKLQYLLTNILYILFFYLFFQWIAMTMSDGNFAKKLSPIMEDFEEEKLKRWESDESTNVCEEFISRVIWAISIIFIVVTFPFSLCVSIRMVQVRNLKVIIYYLYI